MSIRAAIFDLDHTLYNFMDCHERADLAIAGYVKEHFAMEEAAYQKKLAWAMRHTEEKIGVQNASTHSRTLRYQTFLESIGESVFEHAYVMRNLYWDTFYQYIRVEPIVINVLEKLREKGILIGIATDMTCDVQLEKIRILGIRDRIDFLVTSEEAGEEKPGSRILDLCVTKAGVEREKCVFVGDHPRKDVVGPMEYGMQAVWCRHFDPERFMKRFGIVVEPKMIERIRYRFDDYKDCFFDGELVSLGGLTL